MKVEIIPCLQDNYSYLMIDETNNTACVIDPSEAEPIINFIEKKNIHLKYILNTHHHFDHIGGNQELKDKYNAKVICSKFDKNRIPGSEIFLQEEDEFKFGSIIFKIIFVPGHTNGHIIFYSEKEKVAFTGDTLFSLGCGRIFEGTYKQMFASLNKIKNFNKKTKIYCGHEYTKKNLNFCLTYDRNNEILKKKSEWVNSNTITIPSSIEEELKTNIFLRCNEQSVKDALNLKNSSDQEIFVKLRDLKDNF